MVRWRYCLVLALLLLLPTGGGSKREDDEDDERRSDDGDEEDEDDEDEDDEEPAAEKPAVTPRRRKPEVMRQALPSTKLTTTKPRPLECFVCAYKAETPLRACLDPTKFRVHTIACHSSEDRCFTSVVTRGNTYEAVLRGCRTSCVPTPDTTCCELNRCNNQAFAMPVQLVESLPVSNSTSKTIPPTVFFFVTILLVLQTVVKVSFV